MDEYIIKEIAIGRIKRVKPHVVMSEYGVGYERGLKDAIGILNATPAVDVQPVKRGRWITKAENYYKAWQDSGRSWYDMPYFVTGLKFACSNCFEQFDVNAEGVEKWNGCPLCLARMDGEQNDI